MALTRIERNQIFEAIAASTLDPAECHLNEREGVVTIDHDRSGSTLKFSHPYRSPAGYRIESRVVDGHFYIYDRERKVELVTPIITQWANEVKEITEAPDLWAEMQNRKEFIEDIQRADSGNASFTEDEQRQIRAQLQKIKQQVREQFELTSEQITELDEKLEEAAEASKRMGRKDWLIYVLGTITALIITATVEPGVGEHIFAMVIHALGHLFTGGSEPPQIPPQIIT
jgi:hypothetical protein